MKYHDKEKVQKEKQKLSALMGLSVNWGDKILILVMYMPIHVVYISRIISRTENCGSSDT